MMVHGKPFFPALRRLLALLLLTPTAALAAESESESDRATEDPLTVIAQRVANLQPAGSYASAVTALRYDPRVDLQARGLPEGQADVSVRGGLFENTGFNIAAVTLFDPQTGHYFADVPFDPTMLSTPDILTGIDNAMAGFNSTVATVRYEIAPVRPGGDVALGVGSNALRFLRLRAAETFELGGGENIAAAVSYAGSRSDGSRPNGDHEFHRLAAQLQHRGADHETHLLYGYQDKFYGWPGAYTGFATLAETDHTRTHLLLASHRRAATAGGWWEVTGFFRQLDDNYDFDRTTRESGIPGAFEHKTTSQGVGLGGLLPGATVDWRFAAQVVTDELVRSTDLSGGAFDKRSYGKLSLVPEMTLALDDTLELTLRGGLSLDVSNRDRNLLLPVAGFVLSRSSATATDNLSLEYAATSQVPGYTALKSPPAGLFGGNPDLGREQAKTLALNYARQRLNLAVRYQPFAWLDVRLDNELRRQRDNPLRTSDADAYQAALAFGWRSPVPGLRVNLIMDNLTNSNFQQFPGTPAPRRQISLNADYSR